MFCKIIFCADQFDNDGEVSYHVKSKLFDVVDLQTKFARTGFKHNIQYSGQWLIQDFPEGEPTPRGGGALTAWKWKNVDQGRFGSATVVIWYL